MGNQSEDRNKVSLKNYKNKSKQQTQELKTIKKRVVELSLSRDSWKKKYKAVQASAKLTKHSTSLNFGIRPCKHYYPVGLIWLCVQFQLYAGVSFRSSRHCLIQLYLLLSLNYRIPSHVSIRNWACKCGYYRLKKTGQNQLKSVSNYAVIVDESISIGAERLLLVLGLSLDNWPFEKAVSLADIEVLSLKVSREWKSEQVSLVLSEVEKTYKIGYIVSDMGNNLLKSYQNNAYIHLPDITHVMARALERIYKKDALFIVMNQICGGLRRRWYLSKSAPLMPPSQRKKARFHNIFTLAVWAKDISNIYQTLDYTQKQELHWLEANKSFIEEMLILRKVVSELSELLKVEGFNAKTHRQAMQILHICQTTRALFFKNQLEEYFNDLAQKQVMNADLPPTLFCCSDVIESAFGKFKYKISPNSIGGITEFALTIANFGTQFSKDEILQAMESVKCEDLKKWRTENDVPSLAQKRRDIFSQKQNVKSVTT